MKLISQRSARLYPARMFVAVAAPLIFPLAPAIYAEPSSRTFDRERPPSSAGFSYPHAEVKEVPWSIHIVQIDLPMTGLELQTSFGKGNTYGLATLPDQIRSLPPDLGKPVAA